MECTLTERLSGLSFFFTSKPLLLLFSSFDPPRAQNGAQHTLASLLGLGLSMCFARAVSDAGSASGARVWSWYAVLTAVHLLANYFAMRTLALRSLNPSRASLLVTEYLGQVNGDGFLGGRGRMG